MICKYCDNAMILFLFDEFSEFYICSQCGMACIISLENGELTWWQEV